MDTAARLDDVIVHASLLSTNTPFVNCCIVNSCPSFRYRLSLKNDILVAVLAVVDKYNDSNCAFRSFNAVKSVTDVPLR